MLSWVHQQIWATGVPDQWTLLHSAGDSLLSSATFDQARGVGMVSGLCCYLFEVTVQGNSQMKVLDSGVAVA